MKLYLSTTTDGVRTTGALLVGQETFHSMELPWKENAKDISCIPGGTYSLIPYESPRHGSTWRLHNPALNVWGFARFGPVGARTEIEIHTGNLVSESKGCLLVGLSNGQLNGEPAVIDSLSALERLRALIDDTEDNELVITRTL